MCKYWVFEGTPCKKKENTLPSKEEEEDKRGVGMRKAGVERAARVKVVGELRIEMTYGPGGAASLSLHAALSLLFFFGRLLQLFLQPVGLPLARCPFFLATVSPVVDQSKQFLFLYPGQRFYLMLHYIIASCSSAL